MNASDVLIIMNDYFGPLQIPKDVLELGLSVDDDDDDDEDFASRLMTALCIASFLFWDLWGRGKGWG